MMHNPHASSSNLSNTHLFISDLHLCASRPHITAAFIEFLLHTAAKAKALYILGDLFEYWAGDDDINDAFHQVIINAFSTLAESGVPIYLMHGNRDFLIAENFCQAAKATLIQDPTLIDLHGKKALLSHGDDLCIDDVAYQQFRSQVRDKQWQAHFLSQPLQSRKNQIETIRARSAQEKSHKPMEIMDVNADAVNALVKKYRYPDLFIHGHTHRPNRHVIELDGKITIRLVLGDWYKQGSYLACNESGCRSISL